MSVATARNFDIVISGASFAGLALARALAVTLGEDVRIGIVERAARPPGSVSDVRAFAISAASRHMLEVIGVWQRIASGAQAVTGIDITDSGLDAGIRPVVLAYDNLINGAEPATHIVPSQALAAALNEIISGDRRITLLAPAEITAYVADDGGVEVTLKNGSALHATLLVAAEGRKSPLRELAGIKTVGWGHGQTGIVTIVAHERPHMSRAVQHFLPAGPFAILPLPGDRSCITWSEEASEAQRIMGLSDEAFLEEADRRFGGKLGRITLAGPRQCWPLETHLARSYVAPRLALLGDTAHGVHPIAGQGLNLGLRDVAALTEVIADAARIGLDFGRKDVLERYERWRRFDSWVSAAAFDGLNRLFSNDTALLRSAREFGLGVVDRLPGLKKLFVTEAAGLSGEVPRLLKGEPI